MTAQCAGDACTDVAGAMLPTACSGGVVTKADVDSSISFDNERVGNLQGESLSTALGTADGEQIVMINGAPADNNDSLTRRRRACSASSSASGT